MSSDPVVILDGTEPETATGSATAVLLEEEAGVAVVDERDGLGDPLPESATLHEDGSISLVLRKKVGVVRKTERGEKREDIASLTFHRLTGADMRAVSAASDINAQIVLLARSARLREAVMSKVFDSMDAADIVDAGRCVERFLGSGRKTGR